MAFIPNTKDGRWHGYILLREVLPSWDNSQRQNAKVALHGIGRQSGPAHLKTHGRANLANTAWINESSYTKEELTREYQMQVLADALGLSPVDITINYEIFAEGGSWEESRQDTNQYIQDHHEEWEEQI